MKRRAVAGWVQHIEPADGEYGHGLASADAGAGAEVGAGDGAFAVRVVVLALQQPHARQRPYVPTPAV